MWKGLHVGSMLDVDIVVEFSPTRHGPTRENSSRLLTLILFQSSPQPLMAAVFHSILLFSSLFSIATAHSRRNIALNSSLSPTTNPTSWLSSSGHFAFGFYPQGIGYAVGVWLVGPSGKRVIV
ncbi:G-type lectin S-receptor-like serine/threonine-protein kinase LECRK2 [Cinnamomum micranthum f. kanehirae]|uniref:G-type lectin S-receptor-like serine/threonine-protein kinase LECRK2 n=1 Tax=Cinnamomum micranthum f. kanehirae TaxID=337451 RepID=A0A3S3P3L2_9MAGN|nr:G-type lectin S-receptor-like serine/threonine-protein kinase LECRK2 [Cinnamomum micranthum f. kanehirae]